jgi:hypothetical protein
MEVSGQSHSPATLFPGIEYEPGFTPEVAQMLVEAKNLLPLPGNKPQTIAYCYTNCNIPALCPYKSCGDMYGRLYQYSNSGSKVIP